MTSIDQELDERLRLRTMFPNLTEDRLEAWINTVMRSPRLRFIYAVAPMEYVPFPFEPADYEDRKEFLA